MPTERLRCKSDGCEHTILPDTAARTGGYCMRCVGKRKEAERQEFIRQNRREVDRFAGLTDTVDIIRELHTWRRPDPLIVYKPAPCTLADAYARLSPGERDCLVALAIETKRAGDEHLPNEIAKALATLTDSDLSALAMAWIERGEFGPAVLFRGANADVRNRLIGLLNLWRGEKNESLPVNDALNALAWIGDPVVHDTFASWESYPPSWRQHLCVGPGRYAHTGGWELESGGRRDLVYQACLRVVACAENEPSDAAVTAFAPTKQSCPWCGRMLVTMLSVNTQDARFAFLGWPGQQLSILTCDACTCMTDHVFARLGPDDSAHWHPTNKTPKNLPRDAATWGTSPWQGKPLRIESRRPMQTVESGVGGSASAIGGHPCWVQDSAYPTCPDCSQTMLFVAQLDNGDFKNYEGSHYAFLCRCCRVTATCYQQT